MKASREEALRLLRVMYRMGSDACLNDVRDLVDELEETLLADSTSEPAPQLQPSTVSALDSDEEGDESADDGDDEAVELEPFEADGYVSAEALHKLQPVRAVSVSSPVVFAGADVVLSFEQPNEDEALLDLLVNGGDDIVGPVEAVKRTGSGIAVSETATGVRRWHEFSVSKFRKEWTQALPVGQALEVSL